jgi:ribosomal protein L11 methyltransferase
MIAWQKHASDAWLAANEARLTQIAGLDLAIITCPGRVRRLVQVAGPREATAKKLQRQFGGTIARLPRNWATAPSSHPPIRIAHRLTILSEPRPAIERSLSLIIPAAQAFGTGEHSTTVMSLRLLEQGTRKLSPGWRLLDAGTGTGILAFAARRLGAAEALAVDNDRKAVAVARGNARLNRIGRVEFVAADILRFKPVARYEIVTANLFSELLIAALPIFRRALRPRGQLILSGILREQAPDVMAALTCAGFQVQTKRHRGRWVALACGRLSRRPASNVHGRLPAPKS